MGGAMACHSDQMSLTACYHPSTCMLPPMVKEILACPFIFSPKITIADLMEDCEMLFEMVTRAAGTPLRLKISSLWHLKSCGSALSPNEQVGQHFVSGETFGIFGEISFATQHPIQKPTLLQCVLSEQRGKMTAIMEQESGEVLIDDSLPKKDKIDAAQTIMTLDQQSRPSEGSRQACRSSTL